MWKQASEDEPTLGVHPPTWRFARAAVDLVRGLVLLEAGVSRLSPLELRLLRYLAAHSPEPVSRADLERDVWGYRAGVESHTVLSTIHRLRQRLERDPKRPEHLQTDRGRGYRLLDGPPTRPHRRPPDDPAALVARLAAAPRELLTRLAAESGDVALAAALTPVDGAADPLAALDELVRVGLATADLVGLRVAIEPAVRALVLGGGPR